MDMKNSNTEEMTYFIDTVQVLDLMNHQNIHQVAHPQKMSKDILKQFEGQEKKVKIITDDGISCMTYLIRVNSRELSIQLSDEMKIRINSHLLIVFPCEGKDYVLQCIVSKVFLQTVVLSYADPRYTKRWTLHVETQVSLSPVPEDMLGLFLKEDLRLIRRMAASSEGKDGGVLAIEDVLCIDVVLDNASADTQGVMVCDYKETDRFDDILAESVISGRIHDISPSGLGMLVKEGNKLAQVGGLVFLKFHDLLSEGRKLEIDTFKLCLFGIVRYQRIFGSKDEQIFGIKFVKTIQDARFLNFLEKTAHSRI